MTASNNHTTHKDLQSVMQEVAKKMFGMDDVIRLCLVALFTRGHVLLEGNPGLGKTALVRTLGEAMGLPFGRVQFTPDLMPSDVTGTKVIEYDEKTVAPRLKFQPGPIFTSLLLADEINRATPKTQAAMLEAMAERQVTVLGETRRLTEYDAVQIKGQDGGVIEPKDGRPFMVLATQNPIDHEGTYPLPEAQMDRFMFKILVPVPSSKELREIMKKETEGSEAKQKTVLIDDNAYTRSVEKFQEIRQKIREKPVSDEVTQHIDNLFQATNGRLEKVVGVSKGDRDELEGLVAKLIYGLGPRAASALLIGSKAWICLFDTMVEKIDGAALGCVLVPTLRHRIRLNRDWFRTAGAELKIEHVERDRRIDHYLLRLATLTAPVKTDGRGSSQYRGIFEASARKAIEDKGF